MPLSLWSISRVGKTGKCEEGKDKVAVKDGKSNLEKSCLASGLQHVIRHPTAVFYSAAQLLGSYLQTGRIQKTTLNCVLPG